MDGRELYALYEKAMADRGIEVDPWEHLTRVDHEAWEEVAEKLEDHYAVVYDHP